jgi:hypothetical protein
MKILITFFFLLSISPAFCQVEWYNSNTFEDDLVYLRESDLIDELLYFRLLDYGFRYKKSLEYGKTSIYEMINRLSEMSSFVSVTGSKDKFNYNISKRSNQENLIFEFEIYNLSEELKVAQIDFAISVYHFNQRYITAFEKVVVNPKERVIYSHKIKSDSIFYSSDLEEVKRIDDFYLEKIGKKNILKHARIRVRYIKIELEDGTIINYEETN